MNFTHFYEIFLQQGFYIITGLIVLSMQTLTRQDWTQLSLRNDVNNAKLSLKTR